jgi:hypothetical protein
VHAPTKTVVRTGYRTPVPVRQDPRRTQAPTIHPSTSTRINHAEGPPSPPLTASSSMSTAEALSTLKVFDVFTRDPISPRTFFVACQSRGAVEFFIKVSGPSSRDLMSLICRADNRHMEANWMNATMPPSLSSTPSDLVSYLGRQAKYLANHAARSSSTVNSSSGQKTLYAFC